MAVMRGPGKIPDGTGDDRAARLAEALRQNLRRRKTQERAREAIGAGRAAGGAEARADGVAEPAPGRRMAGRRMAGRMTAGTTVGAAASRTADDDYLTAGGQAVGRVWTGSGWPADGR
jgi:hypothetical protein